MKVLLINPPFNRLKKVYHPYFPLGLGYLAAVLIKNGYQTKIYNSDGPDKKIARKTPLLQEKFKGQESYIRSLEDDSAMVWQEVESVLSSYRPDLVGITSVSPVYPAAKKIARLVKRFDKDIFVVMGGMHPSTSPVEVLGDSNVDFLIVGEGEYSLFELVSALGAGARKSNLKKITGLAYKRGRQIYINQRRELIKDLDSLPYPAREALINPWPKNSDKKMILASRGCPFDCAYCNSKKLWQRKYRARSVSSIIAEMVFLSKKYKINLFEFRDEIFLFYRARMLEFCRILKKRKYNFHWSCDTRIDLIDKEIINDMAAAGCSFVSVGLESGSESSLIKLNKKLSIKEVLEKCRLIKKTGILLNINLMVGLPWENKIDIFDNINFIKKIKPNRVFIGVYTPLPGSDLNRGKYRSDIEGDQWRYYSFHSRYNFFIKSGMKRKDFIYFRDSMIKISDKYNKCLMQKIIALLKRKLVRIISDKQGV
jgi:radical SAM superfamily enzyme YgiQ (UPF0313 family)